MITTEKLYGAQKDALACLGAPYLFGAKWALDLPPGSRDPVDCSGFSRWVLGRAGIAIPDGSRYQYEVCKPYRHDPRLLDLGFGDMDNDGRVDHVVVHIGDGQVIEARGCSRHLGHLKDSCPFNKVVLRPDVKWDKQKGFLGWYGVPGVY